MANRRMFSKNIIDSDAFLEMPMSTQVLYFHLCMRADDDGFVNNPKRIERMIGASDDDGKILISKNFIIPFESGVIVIKHWKLHNYIRSDRYNPTVYKDEMAQLSVEKNGLYTIGIPNGYHLDTQVRLGKDRIGKYSKDNIYTSTEHSDNYDADTSPLQVRNEVGTDTLPKLNKDKLNKINTNKNNLCMEQATMQEPLANVKALILNDNSEWLPTQSLYEEYVELYPNVDVSNEFAKMRAWLISNSTKRKTKNGIKRFVNTWLSKAQDRPNMRRTMPVEESVVQPKKGWE